MDGYYLFTSPEQYRSHVVYVKGTKVEQVCETGDERLHGFKELSKIFLEMSQSEKPTSWKESTNTPTSEHAKFATVQTTKLAAISITQMVGAVSAPRVRPVSPLTQQSPRVRTPAPRSVNPVCDPSGSPIRHPPPRTILVETLNGTPSNPPDDPLASPQ